MNHKTLTDSKLIQLTARFYDIFLELAPINLARLIRIYTQPQIMKTRLFLFNAKGARGIGALLISLLILSSNPALALKSDRNQPADIEADDTEIDFRTGKRTFTGNVIVVQGTLRIKADKVIANYKDGALVNVTAWGKLARFKSRPDGKPDDVEGLAKKIFVNQQNNTLTLTSSATLKQGINTARGQQIVYNMANDTLKIQGGSRLGAGGSTGKARPNRKLEDPFKDDPAPLTAQPVENKKSEPATNKKPAQEESNDNAPASEPSIEYAPTPTGRSRLILQPKPKLEKQDEEVNSESTDESSNN